MVLQTADFPQRLLHVTAARHRVGSPVDHWRPFHFVSCRVLVQHAMHREPDSRGTPLGPLCHGAPSRKWAKGPVRDGIARLVVKKVQFPLASRATQRAGRKGVCSSGTWGRPGTSAGTSTLGSLGKFSCCPFLVFLTEQREHLQAQGMSARSTCLIRFPSCVGPLVVSSSPTVARWHSASGI